MKKIARVCGLGFAVLMTAGSFVGSFGCGEHKPTAVELATAPSAQAMRLREVAYEQVAPSTSASAGNTVARRSPPVATADLGDQARNRAAEAENALNDASKAVGTTVAMVVFHALMFLIPLLVIIAIPGFAAGRYEMTIESILIIISGIALLASNWMSELHESGWVWWCLIIPGLLLFVISWFTRGGPWKWLFLFGPPVVMTGLTLLGVLDSAMTALAHGTLLSMGVLLMIVYLIVRKGHEEDKSTGAAS